MQETKSNGGVLILLGLIVAVASAIAFFWAISYSGNFANAASAGLMNLMGQRDPTYEMAKTLTFLAPIGFGAGLLLGIVGLVKKR